MSQRPEILNLLDTYDTAWHKFCHSDERTVDTALYARQAAHAAIVRCFSESVSMLDQAQKAALHAQKECLKAQDVCLKAQEGEREALRKRAESTDYAGELRTALNDALNLIGQRDRFPQSEWVALLNRESEIGPECTLCQQPKMAHDSAGRCPVNPEFAVGTGNGVAEVLSDIRNLWPEIRQLQDGFMNGDPRFTTWDHSVRDRCIAMSPRLEAAYLGLSQVRAEKEADRG